MRKLAGTKIRIEHDYSRQVREIRRGLVPYLTEARKRGHGAFMKKDKLVVNGKLYSLEEVEERIKLSTGSENVVNP
jgi:hypothetical protein